MDTAIIFQLQSILILTLMYVGVMYRRNRSRHVKIMSTAMAWDILLILQIELTRSAIDKATKVITSPMALQIHLFFAISTVVLFIVMIVLGRKVLAGNNKILPIHGYFGWTTLAFRTITLITSYWAAQPVQ
jgi:hypothetical protein